MAAALAILGRIPAWLWLVAALACWGGWNRHQTLQLREQTARQQQALQQAQQTLRQADQTREITNAHTEAIRATGVRARTVDRRLRNVPAASPAAATACRDHEAPAAVLSDDARNDLVALAQAADETADALRACQAWAATITPTAAPAANPAERATP